VTDSDLAALKKAMADAHPDHGGTADAFIKARKAYLSAKWMRKEEVAAAQRRQREEAEAAKVGAEWRRLEAAAAAEEERRRREAAEAKARFRRRAAKAIWAYAAVLLVFAVVALYKEGAVTAHAGRHVDLAATGVTPTPQFVASKPYEAVPDSRGTAIEKAPADRPVAVASNSMHKELVATIPSSAAEPASPEQRAKFTVNAAMVAANTGNIDGTSNCYADAVTYYSKRMSKSDVIADKMRLWERWPTRNYTIRPDSLTANCYVIDRGMARMNCNVKGVFDWEAANSSKRSAGSANITYTLIGLNNSDPLDLRIVDESSTVITRTVTDIGKR
jgi:hypothetical protein